MREEVVIFGGVKFVRFPEAKSRSRRVYYCPRVNGRRAPGIGSLHQEIWKAAHGPIPPGHVIHHRDENPLNNALENLECLSRKEHASRHVAPCTDAQRVHLDAVRPMASAWHASPEGLAWHAAHGVEAWTKREPVPRVCAQCGVTYASVAHRSTEKFCSRLCTTRFYEAHGTYHEQRACAACGGPFTVKKSQPQRACSRKCGWVLRRAAKP